MKSAEYRHAAILFLLIMAMMLVSCLPVSTNQPVPQVTLPSPTLTQTPSPTSTITPTLCPFATPEPFWVEPVTSPTDQLTQVITVYIGNGEAVTVKTESGTFAVTGAFNYLTNPAMIEITLLPNTIHHLEVTASVKAGLKGFGDCVYGGYILTTMNDENGAPLIIAQGNATP